ncbi:MAG: hypothetical protein K2X87_25265 [Gemmataceae bacterium]|nr:hypothetical protein [Gemmataceae bacterium]
MVMLYVGGHPVGTAADFLRLLPEIAAGPLAEVRDEAGTLLGRFLPVPPPAPPPADPPAAETPPADGAAPPKPRTMADRFAGRIGRVGSGKPSNASKNTGEQFTDYVVQKHREGRL